MDKLKVCFLGNWYLGAKVLEELADKVTITTVISTVKDDKFSKLVKNVAQSKKIDFFDTLSSDWKEILLINKYDLIISVSFDYLLSSELYEKSKYGAINLHQSLLPKYRGRDPIVNAMLNNEENIGFSIHYIDEGIDTGKILFQASWPISLSDTLQTINLKTAVFAKSVLYEVINKIIITDKSQGYIQIGEVSLAPKLQKIAWNKKVIDIRKEYALQ